MCLAELGNLSGGRRNQRDVESSLFHWRQVRSYMLRVGRRSSIDSIARSISQALLLYMKIGDQEKEGRALYSIGEVLLHTDKQAAYNHFLQVRFSLFRTSQSIRIERHLFLDRLESFFEDWGINRNKMGIVAIA